MKVLGISHRRVKIGIEAPQAVNVRRDKPAQLLKIGESKRGRVVKYTPRKQDFFLMWGPVLVVTTISTILLS